MDKGAYIGFCLCPNHQLLFDLRYYARRNEARMIIIFFDKEGG